MTTHISSGRKSSAPGAESSEFPSVLALERFKERKITEAHRVCIDDIKLHFQFVDY